MKTRMPQKAAVVLVALIAGLASAYANVQVRLSDGTTTITITDQGAGDLSPILGIVVYDGPVGPDWIANTTSGVTKPANGSASVPSMDISSQNISGVPGTLTIQMTENGFLASGNVAAAIGGNTVGSVTYRAWADAGNNNFAKNTLLTSVGPLTPTPPGFSFSGNASGTFGLAGPYSLTLEVVIDHPVSGSTGFDAQLIITPPSCDCLLVCSTNKAVQCHQPWNFDAPTATGTCSNTPISIVSTVTNVANCGFIATRTWEVTDACTNTTRCSQTVMVVDTVPPLIFCAPNKQAQCGAAWSFDPPRAHDSCSGANVNIEVVSTVTNVTACSSTVTRTWQATDQCGNPARCSQQVTIECAPSCVPGTFTFSGSSSDTGKPNIRTFTVNGVSVKVSAFSRTRTTPAVWDPAYVGLFSKGLGVTDSSEDGDDNSHTVDNIGRDNFLLFEFSQPVIVNRAYLGYVVNDSDLNAWIGTFTDPFNNHLTLSDITLGSFGFFEANTGGSSTRWADLNAGEISGNALVIAARLNDVKDLFKINKLDFCKRDCSPPPPPCVSGEFTFNGSSADSGSPNSRTFIAANGVIVNVRAFSRTKDDAQNSGVWDPAYVGLYSGGLGITDKSEDGSSPSHAVDNVGRDDFLLFEFSEPVVVNRAYLGYVSSDSDLNAWVGTFPDPFNNPLTLSDSVLSSFGFTEENTGGSSTRWADLNAGQVSGNALVIAARLNDTKDQFKVNKLDICRPGPAPSLPSPWKNKDIGSVGATGGASYSNGKFTVFGSGEDIWDNEDEFQFVYQTGDTNCSIVARVTAVQNTDSWAKAGVMIRNSLSDDAKEASVVLTPGHGVAFLVRTSSGGSTTDLNNPTGPTAPYWVRVDRNGSTFTGYYRSDGGSWISLGSKTISMGSTVYIGLAVTSADDGTLCTATFDNITASP